MLIGMADDHLVSVNQAEATSFDILLLAQSEQDVEEFFVCFEHFHEFHHAAIGDIEFAIEAVGAWIALNADFADCREVDAADKFADILAFGIGWSEGAHANAIFFAEGDAFHRHILDFAVVVVVDHVAAMGAEVALDVDAKFFFNVGA